MSAASLSSPSASPAMLLTPPLLASPLRAAISAATRLPEPALLPGLIAQARLEDGQGQAVRMLPRATR